MCTMIFFFPIQDCKTRLGFEFLQIRFFFLHTEDYYTPKYLSSIMEKVSKLALCALCTGHKGHCYSMHTVRA